jgi:hypothetical protein
MSRYIAKSYYTLEDSFKSSMSALEHLKEKLEELTPKEKHIIKAIGNYEKMIRKMIVNNKNYQLNKNK